MNERCQVFIDERNSITAKNRKLRTDISRYKSNIKELERKIEIERWAIVRTNELINGNTEKFIQAGVELEKLLNGNKR